MRRKALFKKIGLLIGIGLVIIVQSCNRERQSIKSSESGTEEPRQKLERWQLKSIHDGDTLRVVRDEEELKIRLCGIDAPEIKQPLGIEARDYLRSLVELGDGELLLLPIEKDRYDRTVAEVYVRDSKNTAVNLNMQMVRDGYAWHYERYSGNCPTQKEFILAEEVARKEGWGIWNGNHQPPWKFRSSN